MIGIPDEQAGELPRAYIVLKNNRNVLQDDIAKFLESKLTLTKLNLVLHKARHVGTLSEDQI